jgi:signal transduction histidine kinase
LGALGEIEQKVLANAIQEGLANVAKHARASRTSVELELRDGEVSFAVIDDGVGPPPGIDPPELSRKHGHFGLRQMRERLEAVGGRLEMSRPKPRGFRLWGALPSGSHVRDA